MVALSKEGFVALEGVPLPLRAVPVQAKTIGEAGLKPKGTLADQGGFDWARDPKNYKQASQVLTGGRQYFFPGAALDDYSVPFLEDLSNEFWQGLAHLDDEWKNTDRIVING